jgi:hypothetical protein
MIFWVAVPSAHSLNRPITWCKYPEVHPYKNVLLLLFRKPIRIFWYKSDDVIQSRTET